jgi:CheY-like chemotaxis protein
MLTKRILVIDDERHLSMVIQACLENLGGWTVLTANSAQQGLLEAETNQPDAILLDVMMPGMDGLALFQKLQENPRTQQIPVILLTARVQLTDQAQFAQLNIVGMIVKPFDPLTLADQVARILDWKGEERISP